MAGINKCLILGRLGRDPELKTSQSGTEVCRFSLAVSEKYNGEERTEWFNCVAFGKIAEVAAKYLSKGDHAFIEGRIQTRKWQGKDGTDRTATEIIVASLTLLGGGKSSGAAPQARQSEEQRTAKGKTGKQEGLGFDGRDARSRPADDDPFSGDYGRPPTDDGLPW